MANMSNVTHEDYAEQAKLLRAQLNHHARCYYVHDAPEIPDAEYDRLFQQLQALEAAHPALRTADSPTQRVIGQVLDGFAPVRHVDGGLLGPQLQLAPHPFVKSQGAGRCGVCFGADAQHRHHTCWRHSF
jgi:hypothetical protein